jgi:hypothetical protein
MLGWCDTQKSNVLIGWLLEFGEYGTAACTLTSNHFGAGRHVWATDTPSLRKMSIVSHAYRADTVADR